MAKFAAWHAGVLCTLSHESILLGFCSFLPIAAVFYVMTQLRTTRRQHGREKGDRDIKITYDGLARADGSARFGFGK